MTLLAPCLEDPQAEKPPTPGSCPPLERPKPDCQERRMLPDLLKHPNMRGFSPVRRTWFLWRAKPLGTCNGSARGRGGGLDASLAVPRTVRPEQGLCCTHPSWASPRPACPEQVGKTPGRLVGIFSFGKTEFRRGCSFSTSNKLFGLRFRRGFLHPVQPHRGKGTAK